MMLVDVLDALTFEQRDVLTFAARWQK